MFCEEFRVECSAGDQRRLEDLAKALEARAAGLTGETSDIRKLILTALALMDEAQSTGAALVRARGEIERLNDMIAEALTNNREIADAGQRPSQASILPNPMFPPSCTSNGSPLSGAQLGVSPTSA